MCFMFNNDLLKTKHYYEKKYYCKTLKYELQNSKNTSFKNICVNINNDVVINTIYIINIKKNSYKYNKNKLLFHFKDNNNSNIIFLRHYSEKLCLLFKYNNFYLFESLSKTIIDLISNNNKIYMSSIYLNYYMNKYIALNIKYLLYYGSLIPNINLSLINNDDKQLNFYVNECNNLNYNQDEIIKIINKHVIKKYNNVFDLYELYNLINDIHNEFNLGQFTILLN